ncbi:MAG: hypothetical protein Q8O30_07580 [Candidatus Omnitrophota bacterium]|nr:hypothetical protein [Candidatus Omnitrophota bacterium]
MTSETYQPERKAIYFSKLEPLFFYFLFAAAIYFVYVKTSLALPFFFILLGVAWFSKRNYFWMAFFFIILDCPAWFFMSTPTSNLPLIKILPGASLSPIDCFTVLMTIKAFLQHRHSRLNLALKIPLMLLVVYFIFSFFWGILFYSESLDASVTYIRPVIYFFWYIFFTTFIKSEEDIFRFINLIFPIVFFIIIDQFYFLSTGEEFISFFDPYAREILVINTVTGELRPMATSVEILLFSYLGGLLLIKRKVKLINKPYIYLVVITAFLSMFISATRVLFVIFTIIFIGVFSRRIKDAVQITAVVLLILLLVFVLIKFGVISEEYLKESAWGRISQVFMFFEGKGSQIDTFGGRLLQLRVLQDKISQNMILGYGFSSVSAAYYDNDWGFFNTILVLGVIGFLLYIFLFISYFKMILSTLRRMGQENIHRESLRVLLIGFIAMLVGYFFTWDFFTPFYAYKSAFIMIFFGISEILARRDVSENS